MKTSISRRPWWLMLLCILFLSLFSFTLPGGEGFEILHNSKIVLQQFGKDMKEIKTIQLDQISTTDQITVKYYHCGKAGTKRHLSIRGKNEREVKNWRFDNVSASDNGMSFHPATLLDTRAGNKAQTFNIYYVSEELPAGRLLAKLVLHVRSDRSIAKTGR